MALSNPLTRRSPGEWPRREPVCGFTYRTASRPSVFDPLILLLASSLSELSDKIIPRRFRSNIGIPLPLPPPSSDPWPHRLTLGETFYFASVVVILAILRLILFVFARLEHSSSYRNLRMSTVEIESYLIQRCTVFSRRTTVFTKDTPDEYDPPDPPESESEHVSSPEALALMKYHDFASRTRHIDRELADLEKKCTIRKPEDRITTELTRRVREQREIFEPIRAQVLDDRPKDEPPTDKSDILEHEFIEQSPIEGSTSSSMVAQLEDELDFDLLEGKNQSESPSDPPPYSDGTGSAPESNSELYPEGKKEPKGTDMLSHSASNTSTKATSIDIPMRAQNLAKYHAGEINSGSFDSKRSGYLTDSFIKSLPLTTKPSFRTSPSNSNAGSVSSSASSEFIANVTSEHGEKAFGKLVYHDDKNSDYWQHLLANQTDSHSNEQEDDDSANGEPNLDLSYLQSHLSTIVEDSERETGKDQHSPEKSSDLNRESVSSSPQRSTKSLYLATPPRSYARLSEQDSNEVSLNDQMNLSDLVIGKPTISQNKPLNCTPIEEKVRDDVEDILVSPYPQYNNSGIEPEPEAVPLPATPATTKSSGLLPFHTAPSKIDSPSQGYYGVKINYSKRFPTSLISETEQRDIKSEAYMKEFEEQLHREAELSKAGSLSPVNGADSKENGSKDQDQTAQDDNVADGSPKMDLHLSPTKQRSKIPRKTYRAKSPSRRTPVFTGLKSSPAISRVSLSPSKILSPSPANGDDTGIPRMSDSSSRKLNGSPRHQAFVHPATPSIPPDETRIEPFPDRDITTLVDNASTPVHQTPRMELYAANRVIPPATPEGPVSTV